MTPEQSKDTPLRKRFDAEGFGWSVFSMGVGVLLGLSLVHRVDDVTAGLVGSVLIIIGMWMVAIARRKTPTQ